MQVIRIIFLVILFFVGMTVVFGHEAEAIELTAEEKAVIAELAGDESAKPEVADQIEGVAKPVAATAKTIPVSELPRVNADGEPVGKVNVMPRQDVDFSGAVRGISVDSAARAAGVGVAIEASGTAAVEAKKRGQIDDAEDFALYEILEAGSLESTNVGFDGYGVLSVHDGGFDINLWRGLDRENGEKSLEMYADKGGVSYASNRLLQRALLSRAKVPDGEGAHSWLGMRATVLMNKGLADGAAEILRDVPEPELAKDNELAKLWVEAKLLVGDYEDSCFAVRQYVQEKQTPFWHQALLICQVLDGNAEALRLGLELMPEEIKADDPLLFKQAKAVYEGGESPRLLPNQKLRPLQSVLYGFATKLLTPDVIVRLPDAILRRVADNETLSASVRLQAAERLVEMQGAAQDVERLVNLYARIELSEEVKANPIAAVMAEPDGSLARAFMWNLAGIEAAADELRMHMLLMLWKRAEDDGLTGLTAVLTPTARGLKPRFDVMNARHNIFAETAVVNALRGGNLAVAREWWPLAAEIDGNANPDLKLAFGLIDEDLKAEDLWAWWNSQSNFDEATQRRVLRVLMLLEAMEFKVSDKLWQEAYKVFDDSYVDSGKGPGPLWLRLVANNLEKDRIGAALLLILEPFADAHPSEMTAQGMANVVSGLRFLGLKNDALMLALEAMLGRKGVRF